LGSNQAIPEYLTNGTTLSAYYFAIPVAVAALTITDRLAIRIYANVDTRTVTLHTENNHLCQVVTTFSKGLTSLNNLTRQVQFLATGTSGTDFNISSSTATHTFNLPIASATNTGKLSSTDWSTFNNKQNTITDPITGTGNSTQIAYFNSPTSITSEAAFNYDASTNRLGVNTTVPNATIGANAGVDSGYSLLLKSDNANYNSIGFGTDSTYGNLIQADRFGSAPSRNLTLYNYGGFMSLTEAGNLGIGLLVPNNGIDIYHATQSQLWLHNAATGVSSTDGVRLALFNSKSANLRNFDGAMSISSEGDFSVITLGAENIRVNSADGKVGIGGPATVPEMLTVNGSIQQSGVLSSLLKTNGDGKIIAAIAGTDYLAPTALSGYVPTSRTITINGTTQNLSADISYTVGTMGGSGVADRVAFFNGTNSITSDSGFVYESGANRLGVNTISPNATIGANEGLDSGYSLLLKNSDTNYNGLGFRIDSTYGHMIETTRTGSAIARNLTMINNGGFFSVSEAGNFGFNILAVNTGVDIYASTNAQLWLHNGANTGSTQGARLAYFSNKSLNLRNFEGPLSLSSESDFFVITLGAENIRVNSANGFVGIGNPASLPSMLTVNGGATITGLTTGQIIFPTSGGTLSGSANLFWDNTNSRLGIGTNTTGTRKVTIVGDIDAQHLSLVANAPALTLANALTPTYFATFGMATATNNFITGAVAGDLCININSANSIYFGNSNTSTQRMRLTASGDLGIGASSPDTKLDVRGEISLSYSASNGLRFYNQDRSNWSSIGNDTATGTSNANLVFRTSAGTALTIAANRNTTFATAATFSSSVSATNYKAYLAGTSALRTYTKAPEVELVSYQSVSGYPYTKTTDLVANADSGAESQFRLLTAEVGGNPTTRLFVSPSGNVGIGTSSPDIFGRGDAMNVGISATGASDNMALQLNAGASGGRGAQIYMGQGGTRHFTISSNVSESTLGTTSNTPLKFTTNDAERMRITSGGYVKASPNGTYLGSTSNIHEFRGNTSNSYEMIISNFNASPASQYILDLRFSSSTPNNSNARFWNCEDATANRAYMRSDGGLANYSGFNVNLASDKRLKKDIVALSTEWDKLKQIEVVNYRYKDSNDETALYGAIAQQVQEVYPELVVITREATETEPEYYGLREQPFQWLTTKVLQEAMAKIEELTQKVNALENKIK
jgi:hypothetical protein